MPDASADLSRDLIRDGDLAYSRPVATARGLGEDAPDRHRFLGKRVVLTGDPKVLATENGRVMALTALRLLPRLTTNVSVWLPGAPEALVEELRQEAARIAFGGWIAVGTDVIPPPGVALNTADAVLSVGPSSAFAQRAGSMIHSADTPERWTTVASNGWCVWVARGATNVPDLTTQCNPVGAVMAAALGVAEVFKIFMVLKSGRGAPADGTPFSLFTYHAGNCDPGPELPDRIEIDALLMGVGAIGNGILATLSELPLFGKVVILDRQVYGTENLGTCMLLGPSDLGMEKPELARRHLAHLLPQCVVDPRFGDAEVLLRDILSVPAAVLNGLDNPAARREAQRIWADLTVDGAIGDFMCQVSCHPGDPEVDTACLRCLFPEHTGPASEEVSADATGLRVERVLAADVVRDEDVLAAPEQMRKMLLAQLGRPICSVTSEAVARLISSVEQREGFEPSVPFVATASAAMVVGEWLKFSLGLATPLEPRFQFDVLQGPSAGIELPESRHVGCHCIQRREIITRVRASRLRAPVHM